MYLLSYSIRIMFWQTLKFRQTCPKLSGQQNVPVGHGDEHAAGKKN